LTGYCNGPFLTFKKNNSLELVERKHKFSLEKKLKIHGMEIVWTFIGNGMDF
jgi:hypothetical protein